MRVCWLVIADHARASCREDPLAQHVRAAQAGGAKVHGCGAAHCGLRRHGVHHPGGLLRAVRVLRYQPLCNQNEGSDNLRTYQLYMYASHICEDVEEAVTGGAQEGPAGGVRMVLRRLWQGGA